SRCCSPTTSRGNAPSTSRSGMPRSATTATVGSGPSSASSSRPPPPRTDRTRDPWDTGRTAQPTTYLTRSRPSVSPLARPATVPQPAATPPELIRNFCIIAHIDHGKSTLADRMLQETGVVEQRQMRAQYLDRMDIERERGITIKSHAVRLPWAVTDPQTDSDTAYHLNMIDTPGHVDFTYEVSRSLAACEGAVLLVDAAQGIEAQTLANLYLAMENDLTIIPVLNKIDLPAAQPEKYAAELAGLIGC